jgi:hypothetical protein
MSNIMGKRVVIVMGLMAMMILGSTVEAAIFYEADFSSDPGWSEDETSGSYYSYSTNGYSYLYSSDKSSHAAAATPAITNQGTRYRVTVQFRPLSVTSADNITYIINPRSGGTGVQDGSYRDLDFALYFSNDAGVTKAQLRIRSDLIGNKWGWSSYTNLTMTMGTIYEARYDRYNDKYMNVFFREVGEEWTQLDSADGTNKFYFIGEHDSSLTFDRISTGTISDSTRTNFTISNLKVETIPYAGTVVIIK